MISRRLNLMRRGAYLGKNREKAIPSIRFALLLAVGVMLSGVADIQVFAQSAEETEQVAGESAPAVATPAPSRREALMRLEISRRERMEMHRKLIAERLEQARAEEAKKAQAEAKEQLAIQQARAASAEQTSRGPTVAEEIAGVPAEQTEGAAQIDKVRMVLHALPLDATIDLDERVSFDYKVANRKEVEIDTIQVALQYPPWALGLVAIYPADAEAHLAAPYDITLDDERGLLFLEGKLRQPRAFLPTETLFTLVVEGQSSMRATPLRLLRKGGAHKFKSLPFFTNLSLRERDQLGTPSDERDGVISSHIKVRPAEERLTVARTVDGGYISGRFAADAIDGELGLFLQADRLVAFEGEEFTVDCVINNPGKVEFNNIEVYVRYDPNVVEMIDDDEGARIRHGINANDAAAIERLVFDHHRANYADNTKGLFHYGAAATEPLKAAGGTLFTMKFRAMTPTAATGFLIDPQPDPEDEKTPLWKLGARTRVSYVGRDLLLRDPMEEMAILRVIDDPRPPKKVDKLEEERRQAAALEQAEVLAKLREEEVENAASSLSVTVGNLKIIESAEDEEEPEEPRTGIIANEEALKRAEIDQ